MTTNVYDLSAGMLTCDSRWSHEDGEWLVYVDDTGYDKIVFDADLALLFAGNIMNIEIWKQWFFSGRSDPMPMGNLDEISIIGIDTAAAHPTFLSDYLMYSKTHANVMEACFGGTGATYAKDCWQLNKCAIKAVDSAKLEDFYSGGNILHFNRLTKETSTTNSASYLDVPTQAKERGFIMNIKTANQPVLVKDAANDPSRPEARAVAEKIMHGKAAFSAPFPGMKQPWTNEKKEELEKAMAKFVKQK